MAITSSYLVAVGKLGQLLEAIRNAQAPERFTIRFLESLGYKSTNDRLFISVLKALGFLDQNGGPQQRYYDYLDETQSEQVLAQGIQEAYEDLFRTNKNAYQLTQDEVKNKLKSLMQGQHSHSVLANMARTFVELVKFGKFEHSPKKGSPLPEAKASAQPKTTRETKTEHPLPSGKPEGMPKRLIDSLSYRIEVVLPSTRDKAIYDAIFQSVKEHLL